MWMWWLEEEGTYRRDIEILAPDKPLTLPPIKPLKAQAVVGAPKITRFEQRLKKG